MTRLQTPPRPTPAAPPRFDYDDAVEQAARLVAPTWPLDRFIAVNPLWNAVDRPLRDVAAELRALSGARLLMPRAFYRDEVRAGRLRDEHLEAALRRAGSPLRPDDLRALLEQEEPAAPRRARVTDVLDAPRDPDVEFAWSDFVTTNVSQFCAAYFDEGQATFGPGRAGGLYASWRRQAAHDRGPQLLMGLAEYRDTVRLLPETAEETARRALDDLDVPADQRVAYLSSLLLGIGGWASWCMYRRWTAAFSGGTDAALGDLLAIRLAWEWVLFRTRGAELEPAWRLAKSRWPRIDALAHGARADDWLLQDALEIAWQAPVIRALPGGLSRTAPRDASVQAVFCIDVRSEVFRRAFEAQAPDIQTLGFAGFFGLPIEYRPLGPGGAQPQLPGLLAPSLRATDTGVDAPARTGRLAARNAWKALPTGAVSTFVFVEAMGLAYAGHLLADAYGRGPGAAPGSAGLGRNEAARRKPRLTHGVDGEPLPDDARCDLAAGILRGMSLTRRFARVVLLVGHGSESRNNPHAAGLDCGACCGQTGEVNARAAAALFNEPGVRAGLAARGIPIPATTHFVAGLHNTTTDEVTLFDLDEVPATHAGDLAALRERLDAAGARARDERARRFGIDAGRTRGLLAAFRDRGRDWAQVRPEWGLANNAALIVAPREHTRHLDLEGRAFLHDYRQDEDPDFAVLEQIMTAPMVVSHWINFQYYASTVDNRRYGSGNKVLHNVVGGHLGVFEGNGGDLRVGLPMQSLHDGERWVHAPLRLSVFLEAPAHAIEGVLAKHDTVRSLVTGGWLHLFRIDRDTRTVHAFKTPTNEETDSWIPAS